MILKKLQKAFKVIATNIYDRFSYDICEMSIGDIMLKRTAIDSCQFTTSTRLLDVKHYEQTGQTDFPFQNTVSRKLWGANHQEEKGNRSFEDLIISYKKNGYDIKSLFEVDNQIVLLNGTHRSACNINFNYNVIRAKVLRRSIPSAYNPFKQLGLHLDSHFTEKVIYEYENIQKYLIETGNTFVALMTPEIYSEIFSEIKHLITVLRVSDFLDSNGNVGFDGKLIQFSLSAPDYAVGDNRLCSKYASSLNEFYSKRYNGGGILFSLNCLDGYRLYQNITIKNITNY